jgi:GH24 family phage-related lysozyme (muramidase)
MAANPVDAMMEMPLDEAALEQAREDREGLAWWLEQVAANATLETAQISGPGSATPISQKAFDLIVEFEVSSKQVYEAKYRSTVWPKGESGVTIGIGYDVGYASKQQLWNDWQGAIADTMITTLERALGVKGTAAKALAATLAPSVNIPFDAAIAVHRGKVVPRWVALVEGALQNTNLLTPDSLGALVSLTYNRGASYPKPGDRYREMRAIKQHMATKNFAAIPAEFRSMKRLWPTVPGLQSRREREARLFETGLAAPIA